MTEQLLTSRRPVLLSEEFILWKATLCTYLLQSCRLKCVRYVFLLLKGIVQTEYIFPLWYSFCLTLSCSFILLMALRFLALHFSSIAKNHFLLFVVINSSFVLFLQHFCLTSTHFFYYLVTCGLFLNFFKKRLFSCLLSRRLCLEFLEYLNRNSRIHLNRNSRIHWYKLLTYPRSPLASVWLGFLQQAEPVCWNKEREVGRSRGTRKHSTCPSCKWLIQNEKVLTASQHECMPWFLAQTLYWKTMHCHIHICCRNME